MEKVFELGFCILGIYVCFLTWGVVQERLSIIDYSAPFHASFSSGTFSILWNHVSTFYTTIMALTHQLFCYFVSFFYIVNADASRVSPHLESFVLLNLFQCIGSVTVSFFMLRALQGTFPVCSWQELKDFLQYYFPSFFAKSQRKIRSYSLIQKAHQASNHLHPKGSYTTEQPRKTIHMSFDLFLQYLRLALCFCFASPFGYASLKYIDYVAMNLGKSCKLLPLVIISIFFRGKKIDTAKLVSLLLITAGVTGFMLFDGKKAKKSHGIPNPTDDSGSAWFNSMYGLFLLLINLALDGAMNTFQDEIFSQYKITSFQMMFHMNWISVVLMMFYLLSPLTTELWRTLDGLVLYPRLFADVCLFGFCGALGQAFVFYTIEKFGAISLVTVTVTRKLFTILLSVAYFGHALTIMQWVSVAVVFAALLLETFHKHKKRIVPKSLLPDSQDLEVQSDASSSSLDLHQKHYHFKTA